MNPSNLITSFSSYWTVGRLHILSSHISVFHATGCFMWALVPKSSGIEYMVQYNQMVTQFPSQKEKGEKNKEHLLMFSTAACIALQNTLYHATNMIGIKGEHYYQHYYKCNKGIEQINWQPFFLQLLLSQGHQRLLFYEEKHLAVQII